MNKATKDFIAAHRQDDIHQLSLKTSLFKDLDMPFIIRQIQGMQKTAHKIPTFHQCEHILYPAKLSLEQSSSEITAKYKASLCKGEKLVDLTGGFGVDCFFMSANFNKAVYVEKNEELCELAVHNFEALGRKNIQIVKNSAEEFLNNNFKVDWVYIDPARRSKTGQKTFLLADCEPDISHLYTDILQKTNHLMMKLSPLFDLSQLQKELHHIAEIHIISVENECKEILLILHADFSEETVIKTVHFPKNKNIELFEYKEKEEKEQVSIFSEKIEKYLYEPNPSILKSGAFKSIGNVFKLKKLDTNSHLYTSNIRLENFPGRIFEVIRTVDFNKESIRNLHITQANLSVRNFPLNVNELRKKLKWKEGGDTYVFASTLQNKKILIVCKK